MKKREAWPLASAEAVNTILEHAARQGRFPPRGTGVLDNVVVADAESANIHVRCVLDGRAALLDDDGRRIRGFGIRKSVLDAACRRTWNGSSTNGAALRLRHVRRSLSGRDEDGILSPDAVAFLSNLCAVLGEVGKD